MKKENAILIGYGTLSWLSPERRSDRYGSVGLFNEDSENKTIAENSKLNVSEIETLVGQKGKLICEVLETRESTHIGDLFHGFSPVTPNVGDVIELGEGLLFFENTYGENTVGLKPESNNYRETFWLDPVKLYNVHEQTVNLYFEKY